MGGDEVIISFHVTHKKSSLTELEKLINIPDNTYISLLEIGNVKEYVILRTCHRFEIYMVADSHAIIDILNDFIKTIEVKNNFYLFDEISIIHLIKVSSGMDSMVIGEQDIQRQVKETLAKSMNDGKSGKILNYLFMKSLNIAKRIRHETAIANGIVSVPQSTIKIIEEWSLKKDIKEIGIIGTGYVAKLLLKYLKKTSLNITLFGRNMEKLYELKDLFNVNICNLNKLAEKIDNLDILVTAVSVSDPILQKKDFNATKPYLILDLGNPRNIEFDDIERYYDLDKIKKNIETNMKLRNKEIKKAEKIIEEEIKNIEKKLKNLEKEMVIAEIYKNAERIREEEILETIKILGNEKREVIENLTRSLMNRLLAEPVKNIEKIADIETVKTLYGVRKNGTYNKNEEIERK
ncbi:MAG: glutamyl-tRNA reductase [Candidatus Thermoplasmatota archaeon]|nr:glutamyl-tRNA reductase [Candidatus Thermoplasmatota archaeon]MCL5963841.1 glutamyl-tRNA reductase [Candidatus Thermoplasmatota archaeon]